MAVPRWREGVQAGVARRCRPRPPVHRPAGPRPAREWVVRRLNGAGAWWAAREPGAPGHGASGPWGSAATGVGARSLVNSKTMCDTTALFSQRMVPRPPGVT